MKCSKRRGFNLATPARATPCWRGGQTIVKTERKVLQQVLGETGGNMAEAARVLGVDYKTIRNKTREYQIGNFGKREGQ
jgi:DNA-binding NtrC family response regulator